MGETLRSLEQIVTDNYRGIVEEMAISMGDNAKSPDDISREFPIEIIPEDIIYPLLQQAVEKKAYAHWGYFSNPTGSTPTSSGRMRDLRIENVNAFSEFNEIVCFRGEIYVYRSLNGGVASTFTHPKGVWEERKLYKDYSTGRWILWDGKYNITVKVSDRGITNNPPPPTQQFIRVQSRE